MKEFLALLFFLFHSTVFAQTFSLYLIGDAGDDTLPGPALQLLETKLKNESSESAIIFLGDNSYEKGIFPEGSKNYKESTLKLTAQLDRAKDYGGQVFVIPGNHDWNKSKWKGLAQIHNEEKFTRAYLSDSSFHFKNTSNCFLPKAGFPGPSSVLLDSVLKIRLIVYDAQWWLQRQWFHKAGKEDGKSYREMSDDFFSQLRKMLGDAKANQEQVIIAAHHPLMTEGHHGVRKTGIYILATYTPLIIFRPMGLNRLFRQDLTSNAYRRLADSMLDIIQQYDHIIYVSGHDHNLQVLHDEKKNLFILSGAGSRSAPFAENPSSHAFWKNDSETGFFQLVFRKGAEVELKVFTPSGSSVISLE
jgi:hypothetical protein